MLPVAENHLRAVPDALSQATQRSMSLIGAAAAAPGAVKAGGSFMIPVPPGPAHWMKQSAHIGWPTNLSLNGSDPACLTHRHSDEPAMQTFGLMRPKEQQGRATLKIAPSSFTMPMPILSLPAMRHACSSMQRHVPLPEQPGMISVVSAVYMQIGALNVHVFAPLPMVIRRCCLRAERETAREKERTGGGGSPTQERARERERERERARERERERARARERERARERARERERGFKNSPTTLAHLCTFPLPLLPSIFLSNPPAILSTILRSSTNTHGNAN